MRERKRLKRERNKELKLYEPLDRNNDIIRINTIFHYISKEEVMNRDTLSIAY